MESDSPWIVFGLFAAGLIVTLIGIRIRIGKGRGWYFIKHNYVLLPLGSFYSLPLTGIALIMISVSLFTSSTRIARLIWGIGVFPLFITTLLVIGFQPKWSRPKWVCDLEKNHEDILDLLRRESWKIPPGSAHRNWEKQISTQEGLEAWVEEVKHRHGI